jgi:hypothetical protein
LFNSAGNELLQFKQDRALANDERVLLRVVHLQMNIIHFHQQLGIDEKLKFEFEMNVVPLSFFQSVFSVGVIREYPLEFVRTARNSGKGKSIICSYLLFSFFL